MARITSYGAHAVMKAERRMPNGNVYVYVLTSDGRVLRKINFPEGGHTRYILIARKVNRETFQRRAEEHGWEVTHFPPPGKRRKNKRRGKRA